MKSAYFLNAFIWRNNRWQLAVVGLLALTAFVLMATRPALPQSWKDAFADYLDPLIAMGTLVIAALVWLNEQHENWQAQLPKRLHIRYLLPEGDAWRTHVTVVNAPLTGESDIRQWGQSIGQTIFPQELKEGDKPDQMWARINFTGFKVVQLPDYLGQRNYGLLVFLTHPIKGAEDKKFYVFDQDGTKWKKADEITDQQSVATIKMLTNAYQEN